MSKFRPDDKEPSTSFTNILLMQSWIISESNFRRNETVKTSSYQSTEWKLYHCTWQTRIDKQNQRISVCKEKLQRVGIRF